MFRALVNAGVGSIDEKSEAPVAPPKRSLIAALLGSGLGVLEAETATVPQQRPPRKKARHAAPTDLKNCQDALKTSQCPCRCKKKCWQRLRTTSFDAARVMMDLRKKHMSVTRRQQSGVLFEMLLPCRRISKTRV